MCARREEDLLAACDYVLLAEDELAAAAYLSPDPVQRGVIFGQDIAKAVCSLLVLLGSLLTTVGIKTIQLLLGL